MRAILPALLFVAVLAPMAVAVPVNLNGVGGIAAILPASLQGSDFYLLTTAGEVWFAIPGNAGLADVWRRSVPGYTGSKMDPPVPVADIADWWVWGCLTHAGAIWSFQSRTDAWIQLPAPPFAPVGAQKKSLGSAKQGYR